MGRYTWNDEEAGQLQAILRQVGLPSTPAELTEAIGGGGGGGGSTSYDASRLGTCYLFEKSFDSDDAYSYQVDYANGYVQYLYVQGTLVEINLPAPVVDGTETSIPGGAQLVTPDGRQLLLIINQNLTFNPTNSYTSMSISGVSWLGATPSFTADTNGMTTAVRLTDCGDGTWLGEMFYQGVLGQPPPSRLLQPANTDPDGWTFVSAVPSTGAAHSLDVTLAPPADPTIAAFFPSATIIAVDPSGSFETVTKAITDSPTIANGQWTVTMDCGGVTDFTLGFMNAVANISPIGPVHQVGIFQPSAD